LVCLIADHGAVELQRV